MVNEEKLCFIAHYCGILPL